MTTPYPTVSSTLTELDYKAYDPAGLTRLMKAALSDDGVSTDAPAPSSAHTHLHTLTIEISLEPPIPTIPYFNRPSEVNPTYAAYDALRALVMEKREALVPVTLVSSNSTLLDTFTWTPSISKKLTCIGVYPTGKVGTISPVLNFSPKPQSAHPRGRCGYLHIGGAEEWVANSQSWDLHNWLHAALAITGCDVKRKEKFHDDLERFSLRSALQLCWEPTEAPMINSAGDSSGDAIIKALLTVDLYANLETVCTPTFDVQADLIGLILHSVTPTDTPNTAQSDTDRRVIALKHFFACMQPAPRIDPTVMAEMQPEGMKAQLLPFQKRTVRLLLERERASGYIPVEEKLAKKDPAGFWKGLDISESGGRVAYRRVTGSVTGLAKTISKPVDRKGKGRASPVEPEISGLTREDREVLPDLLDLSGVRGTMLCEEMGLGKTVEAIALLLKHPHPLSAASFHLRKADVKPDLTVTPSTRRTTPRVPVIDLSGEPPGLEDETIHRWLLAEAESFKDTKVWDEQSQVNVAEVGTTLIVTPPSLLKQWVSEIALHAPLVRVCVYEGWQSLQSGIKKAQLAQNRGAAVRIAEKKRKANANVRTRTVTKYARMTKSQSRASSDVYTEGDGDELFPIDVDMNEKEQSKDDVKTLLDVTQQQFEQYVRAHDVVITTYQELSKDLTVAHPAPPRSRRSNVDYRFSERPRSPLVMLKWWRVIMDEVQLSGESAAAEMVSLIPRHNSLAMSGTPIRSDIKDLLGVLRFLRVPIIPQDPRLWYRLQQASMRSAFESLFRALSVRTTKAEVQNELVIPTQTRFIVPIELSEIELHYYQDTLERQRRIIGRLGNNVDRATLRACLLDLRQICTHIQVGMMLAGGEQQVRGQRLFLAKELMTMSEALEKMKNDHNAEFQNEGRSQVRAMIRKARLLMEKKEDDLRFIAATALYERARGLIERQLTSLREELKSLLEAAGQKEEDDETEDGENKKLSQKEKETANAIANAKTNIRDLLILLHQTWFLMGDVLHQTKQPEDEKVAYAKADEVRKEILALPLRQSQLAIQRFDKSLEKTPVISGVDELQTKDVRRRGGLTSALTIDEANELMQILNDNALIVWNWREKIIELLRTSLEIKDEDIPEPEEGKEINPEDEFYAQNVKNQGTVEVYLTVYAAALTDRKEFLSEEKNLLMEHDARGVIQRKTRAAQEARIAGEELGVHDLPDEAAVLLANLNTERQAFRQARKDICERPLKSYLMTLNGIALGQHRPEEIAIASSMVTMLKKYIKQQTETFDGLYKELDTFRAVFNKRIRFFAALQAISDSVEAPKYKRAEPGRNRKAVEPEVRTQTDKIDLNNAIEECSSSINVSEARLATMAVRGRYLTFIGTRTQTEEDMREDCIICMGSSDDTKGVLLECGHFFCASCFKAYRASNIGREPKCPSCRIPINEAALQRIKLASNPDEEEKQIKDLLSSTGQATSSSVASDAVDHGEPASQEDDFWAKDLAEESERRQARQELERANIMSVEKRREIAQMDMMGEFGSKIDFLIKHLLHYRSKEPKKRHIVFSNWSDSLKIVMRALTLNGITFASFDSRTRTKDVVDEFIKDENIMVFLLHAERESSLKLDLMADTTSAGLTLTTASVCHLLEPVLRHSYELQAIGRVDRLGQKNQTQVYCYSTRDTVESRILAVSIRNGTSIYLKASDADADGHEAERIGNVVAGAGKGGDLAGDSTEDELLSLIL